jgi:hypothetical protein
MEKTTTNGITTPIIQWLKANKAQLITIGIVITVGLIALNYIIEIYAKADLLLNACELCEKQGYKCTRYIPIEQILNITFEK